MIGTFITWIAYAHIINYRLIISVLYSWSEIFDFLKAVTVFSLQVSI